MKFEKTANRHIEYPDHTKIKLNPHFRSGSSREGGSYHHWDLNEAEVELVHWMEGRVGDIVGDSYAIPMYGKGWTIMECGELDYNPDDYAWRRLNYYKPQGEVGYYLIIHDEADPTGSLMVELMLTGLIQRARTELPSSWKR